MFIIRKTKENKVKYVSVGLSGTIDISHFDMIKLLQQSLKENPKKTKTS